MSNSYALIMLEMVRVIDQSGAFIAIASLQ